MDAYNALNPLGLTRADIIPDGTTIPVYEDENKTVFWTKQGENCIETEVWKDFGSLLDANVSEAKEFSKTGKLGEMVRVASIPLGIYQDWKAKGYLDDPAKMARLLNDGDHSKFRTNGLVL